MKTTLHAALAVLLLISLVSCHRRKSSKQDSSDSHDQDATDGPDHPSHSSHVENEDADGSHQGSDGSHGDSHTSHQHTSEHDSHGSHAENEDDDGDFSRRAVCMTQSYLKENGDQVAKFGANTINGMLDGGKKVVGKMNGLMEMGMKMLKGSGISKMMGGGGMMSNMGGGGGGLGGMMSMMGGGGGMSGMLENMCSNPESLNGMLDGFLKSKGMMRNMVKGYLDGFVKKYLTIDCNELKEMLNGVNKSSAFRHFPKKCLPIIANNKAVVGLLLEIVKDVKDTEAGMKAVKCFEEVCGVDEESELHRSKRGFLRNIKAKASKWFSRFKSKSKPTAQITAAPTTETPEPTTTEIDVVTTDAHTNQGHNGGDDHADGYQADDAGARLDVEVSATHDTDSFSWETSLFWEKMTDVMPMLPKVISGCRRHYGYDDEHSRVKRGFRGKLGNKFGGLMNIVKSPGMHNMIKMPGLGSLKDKFGGLVANLVKEPEVQKTMVKIAGMVGNHHSPHHHHHAVHTNEMLPAANMDKMAELFQNEINQDCSIAHKEPDVPTGHNEVSKHLDKLIEEFVKKTRSPEKISMMCGMAVDAMDLMMAPGSFVYKMAQRMMKGGMDQVHQVVVRNLGCTQGMIHVYGLAQSRFLELGLCILPEDCAKKVAASSAMKSLLADFVNHIQDKYTQNLAETASDEYQNGACSSCSDYSEETKKRDVELVQKIVDFFETCKRPELVRQHTCPTLMPVLQMKKRSREVMLKKLQRCEPELAKELKHISDNDNTGVCEVSSNVAAAVGKEPHDHKDEHAEKDKQKDAGKDKEKDADKDKQKDSGKDAGKDEEKDADKDKQKNAGKDSQKDAGKDEQKKAGKEDTEPVDVNNGDNCDSWMEDYGKCLTNHFDDSDSEQIMHDCRKTSADEETIEDEDHFVDEAVTNCTKQQTDKDCMCNGAKEMSEDKVDMLFSFGSRMRGAKGNKKGKKRGRFHGITSKSSRKPNKGFGFTKNFSKCRSFAAKMKHGNVRRRCVLDKTASKIKNALDSCSKSRTDSSCGLEYAEMTKGVCKFSKGFLHGGNKQLFLNGKRDASLKKYQGLLSQCIPKGMKLATCVGGLKTQLTHVKQSCGKKKQKWRKTTCKDADSELGQRMLHRADDLYCDGATDPVTWRNYLEVMCGDQK